MKAVSRAIELSGPIQQALPPDIKTTSACDSVLTQYLLWRTVNEPWDLPKEFAAMRSFLWIFVKADEYVPSRRRILKSFADAPVRAQNRSLIVTCSSSAAVPDVSDGAMSRLLQEKAL
jgi:hypothetical protein